MEHIHTLIGSITTSLIALDAMLQQNKPLQACVSRIPPLLKGHETEPVERIEPETLFNLEAVALAGTAYCDLLITPPWSQKSTRRYVGVIRYPANTTISNDTVVLVQQINQSKAELERIVTETYPTRSLRFAAIREAAHGVMTKHLYRQILCFDQQEIQSIRFSWQRKDTVIKAGPAKIAELMEQIHAAYLCASEDAQVPLKQLMENVPMVDLEQLRIRYPVKVQPCANVVSAIPPVANRIARRSQEITEGSLTGKGYMKTYNAPLPLLVFQDEPIQSAAIGQFNAKAAAARQPRSDKAPVQLVGTFAGIRIEQVLGE
jgi:DNA replication terminus site-binding protein